ncbi:hypothetical protein LOTGIDRAFT_169560 [Lottia gigantea]|uniref:Uncharacterized protein n=1 Tax=Lottia gigantea TaxID=225164 RepID=V3ZG72_LOTGI|nr:hypothetical protein LOTGIDRAFT_169560 [Lottia gigantea]ESO83152.1 hypothetical protein LOTGIDRAFT_169560 [Lottia gigantea]
MAAFGKNLKHSKFILAENDFIRHDLLDLSKSEIEYYAMLAKTGVYHYAGNNIELGTVVFVRPRNLKLFTKLIYEENQVFVRLRNLKLFTKLIYEENVYLYEYTSSYLHCIFNFNQVFVRLRNLKLFTKLIYEEKVWEIGIVCDSDIKNMPTDTTESKSVIVM